MKHLNRQIRNLRFSVIEAKFAEPQQAIDFRLQCAKKKKEAGVGTSTTEESQVSLADGYLHRISVNPVIRLATRVRIEIMKSIADLMKRRDRLIIRAYCLQFAPCPVLKVFSKNSTGSELTRTMSFIEATCWVKENFLMNDINFTKACDRVESSFQGLLAQHFVVME